MQVEFQHRVIGGLPVTITATFFSRKGESLDEWWISEVADRPCKSPPSWIYRKLSHDDRQDIINEAYEQREYC